MTDSVYVGKGLAEWMPKWKANGWRRREGTQWTEVKNEDLWRRLDELIATAPARSTPASPATAAIPKTTAATNWPWRPISSF